MNLFKDDGDVIHFVSPKVQASVASNTYVISGNAETKPLQEFLPGILSQVGPDSMSSLKKLAEGLTAPGGMQNKQSTPKIDEEDEDDDDDIPDLVDKASSINISEH